MVDSITVMNGVTLNLDYEINGDAASNLSVAYTNISKNVATLYVGDQLVAVSQSARHTIVIKEFNIP